MRRTLPHLAFTILAFAGPATAQVAMPQGVALSPGAVLQVPASYPTFGDGAGGVWVAFVAAGPGGALYVQHVTGDGPPGMGFTRVARALTQRSTRVNNISAAPDGLGGASILWFGSTPNDSTSPFIALRHVHVDALGTVAAPFADTGIVVSSLATAASIVGDGAGGATMSGFEMPLSSSHTT